MRKHFFALVIAVLTVGGLSSTAPTPAATEVSVDFRMKENEP